MADKKVSKPDGEEERKIPVFTVLKNNAILKNIFLLDEPPSISQIKSMASADKSDQEMEEILTVGRHPDCNIMLTHPSISRFHLRIHSQPSLQKLSIVDLSSVHGTWISEKKIKPEVRVELNEGDMIRMGGSSRVYRLHWVPLSRAYDLENPFVSPSNVLMAEEKEEENVMPGEGKEEETYQDENSLSVENNQIQSWSLNMETEDSLFSGENSELFVKKVIPSAPPMPEDMNYPVPDEEKEGALPVAEIFEEMKYQSPSRKDHEERGILSFQSVSELVESVSSSLPVGLVFLETEEQQFDKENERPQSVVVMRVPSVREIPESPTRRSEEKMNFLEKESSSFSEDDKEGHGVSESLEAIENQSPSRKEHKQREFSSLWSGPLATEFVSLSLPGRIVLSDMENQQADEENQTPKPLLATGGPSKRESLESPPIRSEQKSNLPSIWSRRGKPASILEVQTGRSKGKGIGVVGIDAQVEPQKEDDVENQSISRALFPGLEGGEDETFTPNKENFTPNTLLLKSLRKMIKVEEIKHSESYISSASKVSISPSIHPEDDMYAFSDKENQTPKVLQERKSARPASANRRRLEQEMIKMKTRAERLPFQSLLVNSNGKSKSEVSVLNAITRSSNSVNCAQSMEKNTNPSSNNFAGEGRRRWYMVADTTCLLNKESRKSLQLLQGLKGTQLIIPRMVVRELDCLKRRGNLFRRTSEISSVLQWIEECMVNTKWWIHVQSSLEEGRPIAPTPPASPQSRFSEGSGGLPSGISSVPFSACGNLMEIVSPTPEDHILECALLFRRLRKNGQLVLLSNDVSLKIKSMAEGLICETAEEFRESLVNPFSERFLWAESSPRGLTWSCSDDVVLREKYYGCPLKKASKGGEGVKGLKLILLHNSHYGQIKTIN
ncbi:hypothetical protein L1049_025411 [Liquidambar formosana]|uniref:FHA domain-containing protein n=1 Tax=Liquidambar formosana TaxID=63359 RepID=A0AAP0NBD8_LIQFO